MSRSSNKIVWLGVKGDLNRLHMLYKRIEEKLIGIGAIEDSQEYCPHITLGWEVVLKGPMNNMTNLITIPDISIYVDRIYLMESTRKNDRLLYRQLETVLL